MCVELNWGFCSFHNTAKKKSVQVEQLGHINQEDAAIHSAFNSIPPTIAEDFRNTSQVPDTRNKLAQLKESSPLSISQFTIFLV